MKSNIKNRDGFTLIEALLSSLILAVGAMVICGLSQSCLRNTLRGWEYEQGYRLIDECLDIVAAGEAGELAGKEIIEGDFGQRYPNYTYALKIKPEGSENLYEVTAIVRWEVGPQQYEVEATTLIYDWE